MITATKMNVIANRKKEHIEQLDILRKNYIIAIYKGFCKKENIRQVHKRLIDETILNIENKLAIDNDLLKYAKRLATKGYAIVKQEKHNVKSFAPLLFHFVSNGKVFNDMYRIQHNSARKLEAKLKNDAIEKMLRTNRENAQKVIKQKIDGVVRKENPIIFYLASKHQDCAKDHLDWQGKVYVDEHWRKMIVDRDLKSRVEKYIAANNIKTFQWVIGRPVWFITRPNCRHFFKDLDCETILNNSPQSLRELYHLNKIVGDRQLTQTIQHDTRQEWYKKENVKNIIKQYSDRLDLHLKLKKSYSTLQLDYAIKKDRLLINKWKEYYRNHF